MDDESIYRIGSVSKLYTAYAILAASGIKVMDRPVTDYVPELLGGSDSNTIDWKEVTIGALMSQQGGIGVSALSPDHGLGYSILLGGPAAIADRVTLRDAVAEVFVTAAEHAALENVEEKFTGSHVDEVAQGVNITLTGDQDRPGLGLNEVYVNGTNLLPLLFASPDLPPANVSICLYSMGVEWRDPEASEATVYSSYRAFAQIVPENRRVDVKGVAGLFDHCENWQSVGFASQVGVATDEFVFEMLDGELESVSSPLTNNTFLEVI